MTEAKFTKGPWACVVDGDASVIYLPRSYLANHIAYISDGGVPDHEQAANAHLISAAPDMYEALELAVEIMDEAGWNRPIQMVCREAIAKARGEQ